MSDSSTNGRIRAVLGSSPECLSPAHLESCLDPQPPAEYARHLSLCPHCRAQLELLRSFLEAPRGRAEADAVQQVMDRLHSPRALVAGPATPRLQWWRMRWFGPAAAAAAAMLLLVAVGIEWRHRTRPAIDAAAGVADIMRSDAISIIAPSGDVAETPRRIEWQPAAGAKRYDVNLLEVDRAVVWSGSTSDAHIDLPPAAAALIVPAKTLLLQVRALDSSGRLLSESPLTRFRLLQNVYTH